MKLLFVYPDVYWTPSVNFGLASMSRYLKDNGHDVRLAHITIEHSEDFNRFIQTKSNDFMPDLIGFHVNEMGLRIAREATIYIRKHFDIPIIWGGPYPTLAPEKCITEEKGLDHICIGEGEEVLLELLEAYGANNDVKTIASTYYRDNDGKIIKNEIRSLLRPNQMPYYDFEIFDEGAVIKPWRGIGLRPLPFFTGRGCPYKCTYCINHALMKRFRGKGPFIRYYEASSMLDEIERLVKIYDADSVLFFDDTFTLNLKRLQQWLPIYKKRIGLPYTANARIELISEEMLSLLSDTGCKLLLMGVESGSERIRSDIMRRPMSNEDIVKAFKLAKKFKIKTHAYVIVGTPTETVSDIEKTVELIAKIKPDEVQVSIFYPFFGTELADLVQENDWLVSSTYSVENYNDQCVVTYPQLSDSQIKHYAETFGIRVAIKERNIREFIKELVKLYYKRLNLYEPIRDLYHRVAWKEKDFR